MRRAFVVAIAVANTFIGTASADPCNAKVVDLETRITALAKNLEAATAELGSLRAEKVENAKRITAAQDFQRQFATMVKSGDLAIVARHGAMTIEIPSETLFESGTATLSKSGERKVLQVSAILAKLPDGRFQVIGHTDNVALQSKVYKDNLELSVARALVVSRLLVEGGTSANSVVAAGSGDSDPVASNSDARGRARNRRIEIMLWPAESELPTLPAP
jgi:chemotaxis protein MotB